VVADREGGGDQGGLIKSIVIASEAKQSSKSELDCGIRRMLLAMT
jgi:hypothetical protein